MYIDLRPAEPSPDPNIPHSIPHSEPALRDDQDAAADDEAPERSRRDSPGSGSGPADAERPARRSTRILRILQVLMDD